MIIIVMGVSGSGKSTIGERLANALHWTFVDADTFHPPANIDKMSRGIPLIDTDRLPWLLRLRKLIDGWLDEGRNVVLACSALKSAYREILMGNTTQTRLVYLKGAMTLFEERMVRAATLHAERTAPKPNGQLGGAGGCHYDKRR
jgi:gluconokinase